MRRNLALLLTMLTAAAVGAFGGAANASAQSPCGTRSLSSTHYKHVIWIWDENHSYGEIIGSSEAPYFNQLATECGLATNYHNISHPSLPNYVAATSGLPYAGISQFTSDCNPSAECSTATPSIFGQTHSWKAYEESMPKNCFPENSGEYAVRHNPPPYFTTLKGCKKKDVPYSKLSRDLSKRKLPAFSFITPNLIDDMHDGTVADGNSWLESNLPAILNSRQYLSGETVVFITFDEGENGSSNECATNELDVGCHVATIVISPSTVPGSESGTLFNHYSLLGSTEQLLGLPLLDEASAANSMLAEFNL